MKLRTISVWLSLMVLFLGCKPNPSAKQASAAITPMPVPVSAIANAGAWKMQIETNSGLVFPSTSVVIGTYDGGGTEIEYDYRSWVLFEPGTFNFLPPNDVLDLRVTDAASVRSRMGTVVSALEQGEMQILSKVLWNRSGYVWTVYLIKRKEGEFMYVDQIKER